MIAARTSVVVTVGVALIALTCCFAELVSAATPKPFDCAHDRCGLLSDGAYPNLVIGRLVAVGSNADMRRIYDWAKAHGYWRSLPDAATPYQQDLRPVAIKLPSVKRPVTVFIQFEEYESALYVPGSLVRYKYHGTHHLPPAHADAAELALYHGLSGCVASLCGVHDAACASHYRPGVFSVARGLPINLRTGAVMPGGTLIDPISLMPRSQQPTP